MLGFLFGTLCLIGLAKVVRGPHHRSFHGHHGHPNRCGHGSQGTRRRGRGFERAAAEMFKRKLDLDDDQADLVDHAFRDLAEAGRTFQEAMRTQKQDLAEAFRAEEVDETGLASLYAAQDEALQTFRRSAVSVLKQIHAVLEPDQREAATHWFQQVGGRWM